MLPVYEINDEDEHLQNVLHLDLQQQFIDKVLNSLFTNGELRTLQSKD